MRSFILTSVFGLAQLAKRFAGLPLRFFCCPSPDCSRVSLACRQARHPRIKSEGRLVLLAQKNSQETLADSGDSQWQEQIDSSVIAV